MIPENKGKSNFDSNQITSAEHISPTLLEPFQNFVSLVNCVAGNDRLECQARGFRVTDTRGTVLFSADRKEVVVGADVLRVTGQYNLFTKNT